MTLIGQTSIPNFISPTKRVTNNRAPTTADWQNYELGDEWLDTSSMDWYKLSSLDNNSALWVLIGGTAGAIETITGDSGGQVPPDAANNLNLLGLYTNTVVGTPGTNTLTITPTERGYPISPYVVGPIGFGGYQTVQSALDAANAAGGGAVYVMPGSYVEDLTLYASTQVIGAVALGEDGFCEIVGVHTPPTTGTFVFGSINLRSTSHVFSSAAAGTAHLIFKSCEVINDGYAFNLPNWAAPGILEAFDINNTTATGSGFVNNTGGATCAFFAAGLGQTSTYPMIISGPCFMNAVNIFCPIQLQGSASFTMGNSWNESPITISSTASGSLFNWRIASGASAAITQSSSGTLNLSKITIDTSANPAIAGAGTGAITVGDITFLNAFQVADTLTFSTSGVMRTTRQVIGPRGELSHTLNGATINSDLEIHAEDSQDLGGITLHRHTNTAAYGGHIVNLRSNGTHTSPTIVTDGDIISRYLAAGYDGTDYALGGDARFEVDGTPGANDMPMRYVMLLSPDGTQVPVEVMRITQAGQQLLPKQPSFFARQGAVVPNATGDGTTYTYVNLTEQFDIGSNFDATTGIFTAPVAGIYILGNKCFMDTLGAGHTTTNISIVPSVFNLGGAIAALSGAAVRQNNNTIALNGSLIASLQLGETVTFQALVNNSTKTVGVQGVAWGALLF